MKNERTKTESFRRFPTDGVGRNDRRCIHRKERHWIRSVLNSRSGHDLAHHDSDIADLLDDSDGQRLPRPSRFEEHGA